MATIRTYADPRHSHHAANPRIGKIPVDHILEGPLHNGFGLRLMMPHVTICRSLISQRRRDLLGLVALEYVADLNVVIAINQHAALLAAFNFLRVILKPLQL